ncbi:hypothetical protein AVEN_60371-1 [Araneus ventricosus]|uniref:Tc1-like transposase DDE domain-containing protein n=1 Tax=Araneus ventricosus TaxID=182803 RepID=A0A4Y2MJ51_ARAVE|nr:hypothetical protein AVEN_60371-1 [Araneus ventricosus]
MEKMDITPKRRTRAVTLSQHTSMTVRDIAAAIAVGKSNVSRIINQQNKFGPLSPRRESKDANVVKNFQEKKLTVLDWPGNSPDVNPIKNLWSIVKRRVSKMDCSTNRKMIGNVMKVWFRDDDIKTLCSKWSWITIEVAGGKNVSECYHELSEDCASLYRTVARWVKAFRAGPNESGDLYRTSRPSIPQHQIYTLNGLLSIYRLWTVLELSLEVGLSHQTVWHILKKWRVTVLELSIEVGLSHQTVWHILKKFRMLESSVALINKQHLANGILRLSDIWQNV